jgi:arylsulfatase B
MGGAKKKAATDDAKWNGFSAGMRAQKGSQYDGGHRVACFIRAPGFHSREVKDLTAHFDLLPTLRDLCKLPVPPQTREEPALDGLSLALRLAGIQEETWPKRTLVVHSQRMEHPEKWHKCAVMTDQHRLVDGKELYDMTSDPGQKTDIATSHPEVVKKLRDEYEAWWKHVSPRFGEYSDVLLGAEAAPSQQLCCHDWHPGSPSTPWNQSGQQGVTGDPLVNGWWAVKVSRAGKYQIILRMRPEGTDYKIPAGEARVKIGEKEGSVKIAEGATSATIEFELEPTEHVQLQTWLTQADGKSRGAYYTTVKRLE